MLMSICLLKSGHGPRYIYKFMSVKTVLFSSVFPEAHLFNSSSRPINGKFLQLVGATEVQLVSRPPLSHFLLLPITPLEGFVFPSV